MIQRYKLWTLIVWVACIQSTLATQQAWDEIEWRDSTYRIQESPMAAYFGTAEYDEALDDANIQRGEGHLWEMLSTAAMKGYVARWRISGDKLYLIEFWGKLKGKRVRSDAIMPGKELPVLATWYSGQISIPTGEALRVADFEMDEIFSQTIMFEIEAGVVTDQYLLRTTVTRNREEIPVDVKQSIRRSW